VHGVLVGRLGVGGGMEKPVIVGRHGYLSMVRDAMHARWAGEPQWP
jgi:hypothetical protein